MQKLTSGGINFFRTVVISFIFLSLGMHAEDDQLAHLASQKAAYEKKKFASFLDEAMFDLYKIPADILLGRPIHIPLLFSWSATSSRYIINEKDSFSFHRVASKYMARTAIYNYAGALSNQMDRFFYNHYETPVCVNVCVHTNQDHYAYGFFASNILVSTKNIVVEKWDSLPDYGVWVAYSPSGRKWEGNIPHSLAMSSLKEAFTNRFAECRGGDKQSVPFENDIIKSILEKTQGEKVLGVRIQTDDQPGIFFGGYLVNGKKSGIWCYADSEGLLQVEYLIEGVPVCARLTTRVQHPLKYRVEKIHEVVIKEEPNQVCLAQMNKDMTFNTPFGQILLKIENGKLSILGGLEREGVAIMWIGWDEEGKSQAIIQSETADPDYGQLILFDEVSHGRCPLLFIDAARKLRSKMDSGSLR